LICVDVNRIKDFKGFETQLSEKRVMICKEFLIPFRNHGHIRILAVGSSLREGSYSTLAAKMALDLSKNYGAETNFLDLRHTKLPIYDPHDSSQNIQEVRHLVEWADAFVLASPDYHGSMSGAMKNFLDHFWEEFAGKTFGYICASYDWLIGMIG
jgi:NAD(P)H-dependent FMN reductase